MELDFYIPELKVAIEWNGIYHILPIHSDAQLQRCQERDALKLKLCNQLGIKLLVVIDETSHNKFIEQQTDKLIKQLS